jgi:hypothetical protein
VGDLILPVKGAYFDAVADGSKPEEFRLTTPFWRKRIEGKTFDNVVLTRGYPKASDTARRIIRPWLGYRITTIAHPHFGTEPVEVFAINVSGAPI